MNDIAEEFFALGKEDKKKVHIAMAELSLISWNELLVKGDIPLSYRETVAGTIQSVDANLPKNALDAVIGELSGEGILQEYVEPICALQDDDWDFNDDGEMAYYAIYNTFCKYVLLQEVDDWLIVNQALSSLGEGADIFTPLKHAVNSAKKIT